MNTTILTNINKIINSIIPIQEIDDFMPMYIPDKIQKKILVLSGGDIKGISFVGALKALEESNILSHIDTFAGTSAGAMVLFLYIIGYSPDSLFEFVKLFDFAKLKSISATLFLESFGLDSGDKIIKMLIKLMNRKNVKQDITFLELFNMTHKTLIMTTVNVSMRKVEYFSHLTHPNMSVLKSVRMSFSIPFIFTPVLHNECMYIDGGCIDNFPLEQFSNRAEEMIGICVMEGAHPNNTINGIDSFSINVVYSIVNGITETSIKKYGKYVVKINTESVSSFIDFDISLDMKKKLYRLGYTMTHNYLENLLD